MKGLLIIDGKDYISVARASEITRYSADYIGQLCRAGKVPAQMTGRIWFVDRDALIAYKSSTEKARSINGHNRSIQQPVAVEKTAPVAEVVQSVQSVQSVPAAPVVIPPIVWKFTYTDGAMPSVKYSDDERPLLPTIKKDLDQKTPILKRTRKVRSPFGQRTNTMVAIAAAVIVIGAGSAFASYSDQFRGVVASIMETTSSASRSMSQITWTDIGKAFGTENNEAAVSDIPFAFGDWWRSTNAVIAQAIRYWLGGLEVETTIVAVPDETPSIPLAVYNQFFGQGGVTTPASSPSILVTNSGGTSSTEIDSLRSQISYLSNQLNAFQQLQHVQNIALSDSIGWNIASALSGVSSGGGGSGSVTSIDASGGTTGLSFAGGPVTSSGTLTLSGILDTENGGTGTSSVPTYGKLLVGRDDGTYDLLATSSLGIQGSGTVTSVATNNGLTGGTISTTGTLGLDTTEILNGALLQYNGSRLAATGTPSLTIGYLIATSTATSTFIGGVQTSALNVTATNATSTFANGIQLSGGCFRGVDGNCITNSVGGGAVSSVSANADGTLTISPTTGAVIAGLNLGNSNIWTGLQQFSRASSTLASIYDVLYVGGTATTTIVGNLGTSTFASSISAISASTTATSTMAGINLPYGGCFAVNGICIGAGDGTVTSIDASGGTTGLTFSGGPVTTSGSLTLGGVLNLVNGGTGLSAIGASSTLLQSNGTSLVYQKLSPDLFTTQNISQWTNDAGYLTSTFAYPFGLTGNATSTLTQFNGGLTAYGTSTIGNGTQIGGLTVSGGATTTGNAYFSSLVSIGSTSPTTRLQVSGNNAETLLDVRGNDVSRFSVNGTGGTAVSIVAGTGQTFYVTFNNGSTKQLNVGQTSTTWDYYSVSGGTYQLLSGSNTNQLDIWATKSGSLLTLGTNNAERVRIDSTGNVGIGTTSPSRTLSIQGDALFSGNLALASLTATGTVRFLGLADGCLQTSAGVVTSSGSPCGSGGGSSGTWSTTTSSVAGQYVNYPNNSTDLVAIGANSTTTAKFWFDPNTQIAYLGGNVGFGTTSPWRTLSVYGSSDLGSNALAGYFTATSTATSSLPNLQTSSFALSGAVEGCAQFGPGGFLLSTGVDCGTGSGGASFGKSWEINAFGALAPTTTLGIMVNASSTIGDGTQIGGLTINGGATTTGNAYFAGNVGIGTNSPAYTLDLTTGGTVRTNVVRTNLVTFTNTGNAASPVIQNASDSNTGFFWLGSDNLAVSTGGIERLRFDAAGNIGIGTTSPYSILSISNSVATAANTPLFTISSTTAGTATTTLFTVLANGNIGIGTTSPWRNLSVYGSSDLGSNALAGSFTATSTTATSTLAGALIVGTTTSTNTGQLIVRNNNSAANILEFRDHNDTRVLYLSDGGTLNGASFVFTQGSITTSSGSGSVPLALTVGNSTTANIQTWGKTGTGVLAVIDNSGSLGIGTTSPYAKFSIAGTASQTGPYFAIATSSTDGAAPFFYIASSTGFTLDGGVLNPTHAGKLLDGGGSAPYLDTPDSVFVSGDYAYIINGTAVGALEIVDISDPKNPVHKGSILDGDGETHLYYPNSLFVLGSYAYVTSGTIFDDNGLEIIDISNPAKPVHKGKLVTSDVGELGGALSVWVSGNYAYVTTGSALKVIDVSNPANPVFKGSLSSYTSGAITSVSVSGNYAYMTETPLGADNDVFVVVDVSNPANPVYAGIIVDGAGGAEINSPSSIFISGKYAYVTSNFTDALEIIDISNPAAPTHKGKLVHGTGGAALDAVTSVFVSGDYAYVSGSNSIEVVDISNPAAPVHKGKIINGQGGAALSSTNSVFVSGNYAYAVSGSNALEVIDIGGGNISNIQIGNAKIDTLQVGNFAQFDQGLSLRGGLNVGGNSMFSGALTVSTLSSTTASNQNPVSALFLGGKVGIGTTSPYSGFSVWGSGTGLGRIFELTNSASTTLASFLENGTGYFAGNVGIGTTTPGSLLSVGNTNGINFSTATSTFSSTGGINLASGCFAVNGVCMTSNLGTVTSVGLSSANSTLSIGSSPITSSGTITVDLNLANANIWTGLQQFANASSTQLSVFGPAYFGATATSTFTSAGWLGIGTTSPYAALSVVGASGVVADKYFATSTTATSTFAGGVSFPNGAFESYTSGITSITNLLTGNLNFETNAGNVSWVDLPVTSAAPAGTVESYTAQIGGVPLLTLYSESDGVGTTRSRRVAIGTSTPYATLTIWASSTPDNIFQVVSAASSTLAVVSSTGNFGLGTSTPRSLLSVQGSGYISSNLFVGGNITSTSTVASVLPYASTTAVTSTGSAYLATVGGSVGIGTTLPEGTLHVLSSDVVDASNALIVQGAPSSPGAVGIKILNGAPLCGTKTQVEFGQYYGTTNKIISQMDGSCGGPADLFFNYGVGADLTALTIVGATGNIGIGTTSPSRTLSVQGNGLFSGDLSLAGLTATGTVTFSGLSDGLIKSTSGVLSAATAGTDYVLPASLFGKAWEINTFGALAPTTTLGIMINASSTIGNGTQIGGLTINGGATTTGNLYISGTVNGNTSFSSTKLSAPNIIGFNSDSSVYISRPANDMFTIFTSDVERLRITDVGNLGIGTTTPNWSLQVASSTPYLAITDSDAATDTKHWLLSNTDGSFRIGTSSDLLNATSTALTINSAGYVGIGTASPAATLDVYGKFYVDNNGRITRFGNASASLREDSLNLFYNGQAIIGNNNNNSGNSTLIRGSTATNGFLTLRSTTGVGSGDYINILGGAAGAEIARFTGTGNVGVGTTTPNWSLQVASSTPYIAITDSDAAMDAKHWLLSNTDGSFRIGTSSDLLNGTSTYLTINSAGNVGIGVGSPGTNGKFEVAGTIYGTGTIKAAARLSANNFNLDQSNGFYFLDNGRDSISVLSATAGGAYPWNISSGNGAGYTGGYVVVSTDGAERTRVTSTGNFGIGTTTPNWSLQVASSTPYLAITDSDAATDTKHWLLSNTDGSFRIGTSSDLLNGTSTALTINSAGYVGIGTDNPTGALQIGSGSIFFTFNTSAGTIRLGDSSSSISSNTLSFNSSGSATVRNNNATGGNSVTYKGGGSASSFVTLQSTFGSGTSDYIKFAVGNDGATEAMRIQNNNGGVSIGIGTTSPYAKLSLSANAYDAYNQTLFNISSSTAGTATTTLFTVLANGNVGIGTTSPLATLSIDSVGAASNKPYALAVYGANNSTIGGGIILQGGRGGSKGGSITLSGGISDAAANGGDLNLFSGQSGTSATSGAVNIVAADSATPGFFGGIAGSVNILAGKNLGGSGGAPGNINIGVGTGGYVLIATSTGSVGIGTTTPGSLLSIGNTNGINFSTATSTFSSTGGINLASGCFAVNGVCVGNVAGGGSGTVSAGVAGQLAFYAADGTTVIGSSTDSLTMGRFIATSTTATSTFAGGLNVGNNALVYDYSTGITSISSLRTGNMNFDTDAGAVSWVDLPVSTSAANGTVESYTASLNGSSTLTIYGQSTGAGFVKNVAVGIGTTSPYARLSVSAGAGSAAPLFAVSSTTGAGAPVTVFEIDHDGLVNINTPGATSTITGNLYVTGTLRATNSYAGDLIFSNMFRFVEATGTPDGLYLRNAAGDDLFSVDKYGNFTATGDICSNGGDCFNQSLNNLTSDVQALASSTELSVSSAQTASFQSLTGLAASLQVTNDKLALATSRLDDLSSTTYALLATIGSLASTTEASLASSTPFIQSIALAVRDLIQSAGEWVVSKVSATLAIFTRVETQTAAVTQGIEMTDQVTGAVYCVTIRNGDFSRILGQCGAVATSTPAPAQTPPVVPYVPPTTTPSAPSPEVATTTTTTTTATTTTSSTSTPDSTATTTVPVIVEPTTTPGAVGSTTPPVEVPVTEPVPTPESTPVTPPTEPVQDPVTEPAPTPAPEPVVESPAPAIEPPAPSPEPSA